MGIAFDTGWSVIKSSARVGWTTIDTSRYDKECPQCHSPMIGLKKDKCSKGCVQKAPWYYHATPEENVMPILREGIKGGFGGEVYASKDPELARRWISFTNRGSKQIGTIPFWRDEDDPRMSQGMDHSPRLVSMLMGPDYETGEGDAVVSNETIPPEDLLPQMEARGTPSNEDRSAGNPGITIHDNPMYSDAFGEMMAQLRVAQEKAEQEWRERNNG